MKVCFDIDCCDICYSYLDGFLDNNLEISDVSEADIICLVGCGYTQNSINKTYQRILSCLNDKKENARLAIFGCPTKYKDFFDEIKTIPEIDFIAQSSGKEMQDDIAKYLGSQLNREMQLNDVGFNLENAKRINVVVQDGCNNRCAFCKSNYLNLKLASRPISAILEIIKFASEERGVNEVNITGLNPSQYGVDLYKTEKLTELIQKISAFNGVDKIFLGMLCIQDMSQNLINEIITNEKIKRVMIPIQSQDDRLLKLMNRRNTAEQAEKLFKLINKERPDIFLETIFLACYPTETKDNIEKTAEFLNTVNISNPNLSFYKYGQNVPSLKSENTATMSIPERDKLVDLYLEKVVPIIDKQRKELLSRPVSGTLIKRDEEFDYYSTTYRFTTLEYSVRTKRNNNLTLYDNANLAVDYLPSEENNLYRVSSNLGNGIVL